MIKVGGIQNTLVLWQAVFLAASPLAMAAPPPKLYFALSRSPYRQLRRLRRDKYIFFFTLETNTVLSICLPNRALKKGSVNPTFPSRSFLAIFALSKYIT